MPAWRSAGDQRGSRAGSCARHLWLLLLRRHATPPGGARGGRRASRPRPFCRHPVALRREACSISAANQQRAGVKDARCFIVAPRSKPGAARLSGRSAKLCMYLQYIKNATGGGKGSLAAVHLQRRAAWPHCKSMYLQYHITLPGFGRQRMRAPRPRVCPRFACPLGCNFLACVIPGPGVPARR